MRVGLTRGGCLVSVLLEGGLGWDKGKILGINGGRG